MNSIFAGWHNEVLLIKVESHPQGVLRDPLAIQTTHAVRFELRRLDLGSFRNAVPQYPALTA